jgi:hypothetical protein
MVLHRHFPAVREMPDFKGLLRCPKSMADREGFETPIIRRGFGNHHHHSLTAQMPNARRRNIALLDAISVAVTN